jgi:hypothetical protein
VYEKDSAHKMYLVKRLGKECFFLKKIFLIASILIIVFAGVYTFVKVSASLEAKAAGFAKNKKVQLISIGNKSSLGDI